MSTKTKVSIEEINGRYCTVIRKPFNAAWIKEQLDMGNPVIVGDDIWHDGGGEEHIIRRLLLEEVHKPSKPSILQPPLHGDEHLRYYGSGGSPFGSWTPLRDSECLKYTYSILPPLPRHPKQEDAPLLHRYMAEGLDILAQVINNEDGEVVEESDYISFMDGILFINNGYGQTALSFDYSHLRITHTFLNDECVEAAIEAEV